MDANDALLESWELSLHDKAPRTVALYLDEARRFAAGRDLCTITKRDVLAWLAELRDEGLAQATIRSRWIALRSLYRWALAEGEIEENPVASITVPRAKEPAPDVLSDDTVRRLLKACEGQGFNERRDAALIRCLLTTGVRVSELVDLAVDDVDLRSRVAHVRHGKGDRARLVRFDASTAAALDRYKRVRGRHRLAHLPWLWIGHRGRMTRKGVPAMLNKRAEQAGVEHVHPHQFRHTWADRWLSRGGTEGDLQRLGGWESAEIMRRYGEARAVERALGAYDAVMGDLS